MAAFSDYLEGKIAQFIFKNNAEAFASPGDDLYVALFTASTGLETNSPSAEVSGGSYARLQVLPAAWTVTGGLIVNAAELEFALATAPWGTITHGAIMDASGAGNVLYWGALATSRDIGDGDQLKINAGDLEVTHD